MMLAAEFGALSKVLICVERAIRRAETVKPGSVHESPVGTADAPKHQGDHNDH
jgi:hypothetical protein